jgi:flagellar protein FliO/FliZ
MQRLHFWLTSSLLSLAYTTAVVAQDSEKMAVAKTLTTSPVTNTALFETLLGLGLVLGLIAILAWLIKRTGRFQTTANGEIKMIAGLSLGPRERAVLLEVGGEKILVGVTTQHIQTLHVIGQTANKHTHQADKYGQFDQQLQHIIKQERTDD